MRFWLFFFSSTFREWLKLSSKPKSEASVCTGSKETNIKNQIIRMKIIFRNLCNYRCTNCWMFFFFFKSLITCRSLICWYAVDDVRGQCTGGIGWVDSRAHRVSSLICSLRRDGDWASQGYWCKWLHCFWFRKFGLNWENEKNSVRNMHFLSPVSKKKELLSRWAMSA